jgi:hypothetical protein
MAGVLLGPCCAKAPETPKKDSAIKIATIFIFFAIFVCERSEQIQKCASRIDSHNVYFYLI